MKFLHLLQQYFKKVIPANKSVIVESTKEVLFPSLFVFLSYILFTKTFQINSVLFFVLLFFSIYPIRKFIFNKKMGLILIFFWVGLILVSPFIKHINNIELWGDETGVIILAKLPFKQIATQVFRQHAAVPPLDYWLMHYWDHLVSRVDIYYQEIAYRTPYVIIHIVTACLFSYSIYTYSLRKRAKIFSYLILLISFLSYLFNPLLFIYSFEVRFYALSNLGLVVLLYCLISDKLYDLRFLSLSLLFCLNSIIHVVVLSLFYVIDTLRNFSVKKINLKMVFILLAVGSLALLDYSHVLIPTEDSFKGTGNLVIYALQDLYYFQFTPYYIILILTVPILYSIYKKKTKILQISVLLCLSVVIILSFEYSNRYSHFHVRHLLFVIPLFLTATYLAIIECNNRFIRFAYLVIIALTIVYYQIPPLYSHIKSQTIVSKILLGTKALFTFAEKNKSLIIIAPNDTSRMDQGYYDFYMQKSIQWYSERYRNVEISYPDSIPLMCGVFKSKRNSILFIISSNINCPDSTVVDLLNPNPGKFEGRVHSY